MYLIAYRNTGRKPT